MERYVEPSLKARRLFYLAIVLFCYLALVILYLDDFLPPISPDIVVALEQANERSFYASIISTIFWIGFSVVTFYYTKRAVQSRQWPPAGMAVPFRLKVKEINNPTSAWIYYVIILLIFVSQIIFTWYVYAKQQTIFGSIKQQIDRPSKSNLRDNSVFEDGLN